MLIKLNNEDVGIRSIARILEVSKTIIQRYIKRIADKLKRPNQSEYNQSYEVDELRTYFGKKKKGLLIFEEYILNDK